MVQSLDSFDCAVRLWAMSSWRTEPLNHDLAEHRLLMRQKAWDRRKPLVVFDELHKMPDWKAWLKGIYDVEGLPPALLVTGSARLAAFRKTGDSLCRAILPLSPASHRLEGGRAACGMETTDAFERLLGVGGFPEPFLPVATSATLLRPGATAAVQVVGTLAEGEVLPRWPARGTSDCILDGTGLCRQLAGSHQRRA